ncbi:MAG: DUF4886 domain-containing protein [Clostridia bacterium]
MIKILSVGNSFAQDAQKYVPAIAAADGIEIMTGNLFIGGCSLETHWRHAKADAKEYWYHVNDNFVKMAAIQEVLMEEDWDYVTFQQSSGLSGIAKSYQPFLNKLSKYVKTLSPQSTQLIHQTWAYEIDSTHGDFLNYDCDQKKMFDGILLAYEKAALAIGENDTPAGVIPCGVAIQLARSQPLFDYANGGVSLCRDGFHAHFTLGRYLLGAVWYEFLTGHSILENSYVPFDPEFPYEISAEELAVLKKCAHDSYCQKNA